MENKQFQFKTNINCGGCVASVKPYLENAQGIVAWSVDTSNKDKILKIQSEGLSEEQVMAIVQKAGFKLSPLVEQ